MTDLCPVLTTRPAAHAGPDAEFWRRFFDDRELFYSMCVRWLRGNRFDAEDAISRGTLRALDFVRRRPDEIVKFRAWMLRLLHNLCVDIRKAQDRITALPVGDDDDSSEPVIPCPAPAPDRALYSRELRGVLDGAVASLPSRLRGIFCLRVLDEVPYSELCRRAVISPENARKRLQLARLRLRERLVGYT